MEEAVDQKDVILFPAPEGAGPLVTRDHEDLARLHGSSVICTVPLGPGSEIFGAVTLERSTDETFDESDIEW
jgi:hypothetical protein